MALGVIRAIEELGLRVPEDISIIGFDNLKWGEWMKLQLTSMEISKVTFAKQAIDLLFNQEPQLLADPVVIEKGSVRVLQ